MSMQRESEVDYKTKATKYFKAHIYQKFIAIAGFGAAAIETFNFHSNLLSLTSFAGVVAGGMAISDMVNAKSSVSKSAFLLIGGLGLGVVANILPFTTILHQATGSIATSGAIGLIEIGIKKYKQKI